MPQTSHTNDPDNLTDRLSDAIGVSRGVEDNTDDTDDDTHSTRASTEPSRTSSEQPTDDVNKKKESHTHDDNLEAARSRTEKHRKDKQEKHRRFIQHFGKRGDDRRSGLRTTEDGDYAWSAIDYEHDEGVIVFRMKRNADELSKEKKAVSLDTMIELNPDPESHSRLKELQTYEDESAADESTDAADNPSGALDTKEQEQESKTKESAVTRDEKNDTRNENKPNKDTKGLHEQIDAVADEVGLNDTFAQKLYEMVTDADHAYTEEMIRNAASGLLEHQQAKTNETQQTSNAQTETKKENTNRQTQKEKERAKQTAEQVANQDIPEAKAEEIQQANTKKMQEHYKKTRKKNTDNSSKKEESTVGIADRVGSKDQVKQENIHETESEQVGARQHFFAVGKQVLVHIRDLYENKDTLTENEKQNVSAITDEISAYEVYQKQLDQNKTIANDEIKQRVIGINKAVNAHPQLRKQQPELIAQLKDAEHALDINTK